MVAVDDVQWLDTPTAHVLAFALRRLTDAPVRVLATCRGPLPPWLRDAVVEVGPLPASELGALLKDRLGLELARPRLLELHRVCGGNGSHAHMMPHREVARQRSLRAR